jgi:hypothetical protein
MKSNVNTRYAGLIALALFMLVQLSGCSDEANMAPNSPAQNWPPTTLIYTSPRYSESDVESNFVLAWSSHDPEGGPVNFDVYLGADSIPQYAGTTTYNAYPSPSHQQEIARDLLAQICRMQIAYHSQYHSYCLDGVTIRAGDFSFYNNLGIVSEQVDRYSYTMTVSAGVFTCTASGNIDFDSIFDTWTIDQTQTLTCISDDIDTPFLPNTRYYWQVIARDDNGNTSAGPIWNFRVTSNQSNRYPEIPQLVSPANGSIGNIENTLFQWECSDPDGDFVRFYVYLNDSPDLNWYWRGYTTETIIAPPQKLRSKVCETLRQIYLLEDAYRDAYSSYWFDGATARYRDNGLYFMGVIVDSLDPYCYSIAASSDTFTCTAIGNLDTDPTYDQWTIDEDSLLICVTDDFGSILPTPAGTTLYWRVVAYDRLGHASLSPIWTFISGE